MLSLDCMMETSMLLAGEDGGHWALVTLVKAIRVVEVVGFKKLTVLFVAAKGSVLLIIWVHKISAMAWPV